MLLLVALPREGLAWKPITHVRLAQEAVSEAIRTGKVRIELTDYQGSKVLQGRGGSPLYKEYAVDPATLTALRAHPEKYYAGVLGPDAYPDIATGQMLVHPPGGDVVGPDVNLHGPGTDAYLRHIWRRLHRNANTPANRAFVLGYLAHAAGDLYAHTYINSITGGIFDLDEKGVRHIVLEGYLAKRAPQFPPDVASRIFTAVARGGVTDGVAEFIAEHINPVDLPVEPGDNKGKSLPYLLGSLRKGIQQGIDSYDATVAWFERCLNDATGDLLNIVLNPLAQAQATSCFAALVAYKATFFPIVAYARGFVERIGKALVDWSHTSHRVAIALVFNPEGKAKVGEAIRAVFDYLKALVPNLLGIPDWLSDLIRLFGNTVGVILNPLKPLIDYLLQKLIDFAEDKALEMGKSFLDWILQRSTGMTSKQLLDKWDHPDEILEDVFRKTAKPGDRVQPVTLAKLNADMGLADKGRSNMGERFDIRRFPPAFNSMNMIRLTLLTPAQLNDLLKQLGSPRQYPLSIERGVPANAMLGFAESIDGSGQWLGRNRMLFALDCAPYTRIFMKQPGPANPAFGENVDACKPLPGPPALVLDTDSVVLPAGGQASISASQPVVFRLVGPPDWLVPARLSTGPGFATSTTVFAPPTSASQRQLTLYATAQNGEVARTAITVLPDLVITRVDASSATLTPAAAVGQMAKIPAQSKLARKLATPVARGKLAPAPRSLSQAASAGRIRSNGTPLRTFALRKPTPVAAPVSAAPASSANDASLGTSECVQLGVSPAVEVTWSVTRGEGGMGSPEQRGALARLASLRAQLDAISSAPSCRSEFDCLGSAVQNTLRTTSLRMAILAQQALLGAAASTYCAPAQLPEGLSSAEVTATAQDRTGRIARRLVWLRGPQPALRISPAQVTLAAGASQVLSVSPNVPVSWSVAGGASNGSFGPLSSPGLSADVTAALSKLRSMPSNLTDASRALATAEAMLKAERERRHAQRGALSKTTEGGNTYQAPSQVAAPRTVTITAAASDGSGRTAATTLKLVPSTGGVTSSPPNTTNSPDSQNVGPGGYVRRCAATPDFVTQLYRVILKREPDSGGHKAHVDLINGGTSREAVLRGFFQSEEYRLRNVSNADYVRDLYRAILGRDAEPGGFDYWLADLTSRGQGRINVFTNIINSPESQNLRCASCATKLCAKGERCEETASGPACIRTVVAPPPPPPPTCATKLCAKGERCEETANGPICIGMVSSPPPPPPPATEAPKSWTRVSGLLTQISVGFDGTIWGIGDHNDVWSLTADGNRSSVSGALKQISVVDRNEAWGINANDEIVRWTFGTWKTVEGRMKQVTAAKDGTVWAVNTANELYQLNRVAFELSMMASNNPWQKPIFGGRRTGASYWMRVPGAFKQISVGAAGQIWAVSPNDEAFRWTGDRFEKAGAGIQHVSVDRNGKVWAVGTQGEVFRYRGGVSWERLAGILVRISVNGDQIWGVNAQGEIWRWDGGK